MWKRPLFWLGAHQCIFNYAITPFSSFCRLLSTIQGAFCQRSFQNWHACGPPDNVCVESLKKYHLICRTRAFWFFCTSLLIRQQNTSKVRGVLRRRQCFQLWGSAKHVSKKCDSVYKYEICFSAGICLRYRSGIFQSPAFCVYTSSSAEDCEDCSFTRCFQQTFSKIVSKLIMQFPRFLEVWTAASFAQHLRAVAEALIMELLTVLLIPVLIEDINGTVSEECTPGNLLLNKTSVQFLRKTKEFHCQGEQFPWGAGSKKQSSQATVRSQIKTPQFYVWDRSRS